MYLHHFKFWIFLFITLLGTNFHGQLSAQDVSVKYGNRSIALNEVFTITMTLSNENIRSYSGFPEIKGMNKIGTSSQTSTTMMGSTITVSQSIIQNYQPQKEGTIVIPDFSMMVNNQSVSVPGTTITVGPAKQRQATSPFGNDIFEEFFGRRSGPTEFLDVQDDAFFSLSTNKNEVYVGEGFHMELALYVATSNRAEMQFFDLGTQLSTILKKVKPENCWEENFNISEISRVPVELGGKQYIQYKLFEADYFPINTDPIRFPSAGLNMIKYKVARNPSFFGNNRQQDFKMFYTKPKIIKVKDLPPHPLKDKVSVGAFKLEEGLGNKTLETGKSTPYIFKITGIGNISGIAEPAVKDPERFEVYPPNVIQGINRENGVVSGSKSFEYYLIPKEPGVYDLGNLFQWVYFDIRKNRYDTLRSKALVQITGLSQKDQAIKSTDLGPFYDRVLGENNRLYSLNDNDDNGWIITWGVSLSILGVLALYIKSRKS